MFSECSLKSSPPSVVAATLRISASTNPTDTYWRIAIPAGVRVRG
jgi:hypothetical protein